MIKTRLILVLFLTSCISEKPEIMMTADSVAEMIEWVIELENNTQMRTLSFDVGNYNG